MTRAERLFEAVEKNKIKKVKKLLTEKRTWNEWRNGEKEEFPCSVNAQNEYGETLLKRAILYGSLDMASLLIESGAILSEQDKTKLNELLHKDVNERYEYTRDTSRIKTLIELGAEVNDVRNGENVFDIAMRRGLPKEIVQQLKVAPGFILSEKKKSSLNESLHKELNKDYYWNTLGLIMRLESLIEGGADVNYVGENGENTYDIAMRRGLPTEIVQQITNAAGFILSEKNKATVNELLLRELGEPTKTIRKNYVEELLKAGADINAWDKQGNTALINALSRGDIDKYSFLIERNANINTPNSQGEFPLDIAVTQYKPEIVKALLSNPDVQGDVGKARDILGLSLRGVLIKTQRERKPYINLTKKPYSLEALSSEKLLQQYKQMKLGSLYFRTDQLELNEEFARFLKQTTESGVREIVVFCNKDQFQLTKEQFNDFIKNNEIAINLRIAPVTVGDLAEIAKDQFGQNNLLAIKEIKDYKFHYNNGYAIDLLNSETSDQNILDNYAHLKEETAKKHQSLVAYRPQYITSDDSLEEDRINIGSAVAYDLEITHETNLALQQQNEYEYEKTSEKQNELAIDKGQAAIKYNRYDAKNKAQELFEKSFPEYYLIDPNADEGDHTITDAVKSIFDSDSKIEYITEQALALIVDNRHLLRYGINLKNMPIGLAFKDGIIFASEERVASMPINGFTIKLNQLSPSVENPLQYSHLRSASKSGITGNTLYGSEVCPLIRGDDQYPNPDLGTRSLEYPHMLRSVSYNVDEIKQEARYLSKVHPNHMVEQRQVREEEYRGLSYTHLTTEDKKRLDNIYRDLDARAINGEAFNNIIRSGVIETGDFLLSEKAALFLDELFTKILRVNDLEKQYFFRRIINEGGYQNSYIEDIFNATDEFYQKLHNFLLKQEISEEYHEAITNQLIEAINVRSKTSYSALIGRIIDVLEATAANGGNLYEQLDYIKQDLLMIGNPKLINNIKSHGINVVVSAHGPPDSLSLIDNTHLLASEYRTFLFASEYRAYLSTIPVHLRPSADYVNQYYSSGLTKEYTSGKSIEMIKEYGYIQSKIENKVEEHDRTHINVKNRKSAMGIVNLINDYTAEQVKEITRLLGLNILTSTGKHYDSTRPDQEFGRYISLMSILLTNERINEDVHIGIITNKVIRDHNKQIFKIKDKTQTLSKSKSVLDKERQLKQRIDHFINLHESNHELNFAQIMSLGLVSNLAPNLYPKVAKDAKVLEQYKQYFSQLLRISLSTTSNKEYSNDFDELTERANNIARIINFLATEHHGKPMHQTLTDDGKYPENLVFFTSAFLNDLEVSYDKVKQLVENLRALDPVLKQKALNMLDLSALPFDQGKIINNNFPQISLANTQNPTDLQMIIANDKTPKFAYEYLTRFNQISIDSRQNALVDLSNLKKKYYNLEWSAIEGKSYKQIKAEIIKNQGFVQRILAKNSQDQALVSEISADLLRQMLQSTSTHNDGWEIIIEQTVELLFDPQGSLTDQLTEIEANQRFINSIFKSIKEPIAQQQFLSSLLEEPLIPNLKLAEILRFLNAIDPEALKAKDYDVLGLIQAVDHEVVINHFDSFKLATEFFIQADSQVDFKELTNKLQRLAKNNYSPAQVKKIISYSLKNQNYNVVDMLTQISGRTNNIDKIVDFMTNRTPVDLEVILQKFAIKNLAKLKPDLIKIVVEIALKFGDDLTSKQYNELLAKAKNNNDDAKLLAAYLLAPDTDFFTRNEKVTQVFDHINDPAALKDIFVTRNLERFKYNEAILQEKIKQIKPLQDSDKLYQNTIKIYELAKEYSALDPSEMQKRSIELQRNRMLLRDNQVGEILENDLNFIALSCEAMYRTTGKFPRVTQILSTLTAAVMQEGHIGQQISTGQGKTLIGALDTAYLAYTGQKVVITTANKQLARRDLQDGAKFYESLSISSGSDIIAVESEVSGFTKHQITYSTSSDIALFFAQMLFDQKPESLEILSGISIVADELDDTLNRPINYKLAVPLAHITQKEARILYKTIAIFSETDVFLKSNISADNQVHNLKESIKERFSKLDTSYTYPLTLTQMADLKKRPGSDAQELYYLHQVLDKLKNKDIDSIFKTLLSGAVEAKKLVENKHYVILKEQLDNPNEPINAIPVVGERAARESRFGEGIQGFLHYEIERKYSELVDRFNYYIPTSVIFDLNAKNLFDTIRMAGGRVFGFSGTLGDNIQRNEFSSTLGIQSINMPDHEKPNKIVVHKEVANKADQDFILYNELAALNEVDPSRPIIIFCPDLDSVQEVYGSLKKYGRNIQLADPTASDEELDEIVNKAGKEGAITITTQVLGIGHDFSTKHPAGFSAFNICTKLTPNALGQCEGRIGRNGELGQITSLFNRELYSQFANHAAFMQQLSLEQTHEREQNRVSTDIAQYFNKINAGDARGAIKTLDFINKKWKKILSANQRQKASERISISELKQELIKAVNQKYPAEARGLAAYLAELNKGLPGTDGKIIYEKDIYSADHVEQDLTKSAGYVITHQNYPGLDEKKIAHLARSVPIEQVEKPTDAYDEKYQVFYDAFAEAQFTTLYAHILSVDDSKIEQPLDYHIVTDSTDEIAEHEMRLFLQDNKLYCQIKDKQPLELKKDKQDKNGIPEVVYQKIITALEQRKPFKLDERDRVIIKYFALGESYTPVYDIKGEGSSANLMLYSYKNYYKDYQASVRHSEEVKRISNIMANMEDIQNIDIAKLELGKYQAFTISTKVNSEGGHKESILTDGRFLYWINRGYGVEKPGIRIFKVTKDIQSIRDVLGSLKIPVSQNDTREKIYSLLREDNDKTVPEYVQVDMDAQTTGNCGYAQTEALLMGAALAGRLSSSGNKLPKVDSRKFQNALTSATGIYQDLSLANQMRAFEEVLYIKDQTFFPKYLSQAAKDSINDRRTFLTDPISQQLFEKITQRFADNIDIFQNTIYASDANTIFKKAVARVMLDSEMGTELQRFNSREESMKLLELYVESSSAAQTDLEQTYNKVIKTRIKDKSERSKLLTEIIKYINGHADVKEVLASLSAALNPNNIVAIDTSNTIKKALFYVVEKGDAVMVSVFYSVVGGDAGLSAQELSVFNELKLKSNNVVAPQVATTPQKTTKPKENIVIKTDPDPKPQSIEVNYRLEAEELGAAPDDAKKITKKEQVTILNNLVKQGEKPSSSTIDYILQIDQMSDSQIYATEWLPLVDAMKIMNYNQRDALRCVVDKGEKLDAAIIDDITKINNHYQVQAMKWLPLVEAVKMVDLYQIDALGYVVDKGGKLDDATIDGITKINNYYQAEATKLISPRFFSPGDEHIDISHDYQLRALKALHHKAVSLDNYSNLAFLNIINEYQAVALGFMPLADALKFDSQDKLEALLKHIKDDSKLLEYINKDGQLEKKDIDQIFILYPDKFPKPVVDSVVNNYSVISILGDINSYMQKNDPLKIPGVVEAATMPPPLPEALKRTAGRSNRLGASEKNLPSAPPVTAQLPDLSSQFALAAVVGKMAGNAYQGVVDYLNRDPAPLVVPKELTEINDKLYQRLMKLNKIDGLSAELDKTLRVLPHSWESKVMAQNMAQKLVELSVQARELTQRYYSLQDPNAAQMKEIYKEAKKLDKSLMELVKDATAKFPQLLVSNHQATSAPVLGGKEAGDAMVATMRQQSVEAGKYTKMIGAQKSILETKR